VFGVGQQSVFGVSRQSEVLGEKHYTASVVDELVDEYGVLVECC
jgi:hypothetical protein